MVIHLPYETWGDSVPMELKFNQSVNSLCTYVFIVMVFLFFLFLILVFININLTGNNDIEMVIPLYNIAVMFSNAGFLNLGTSVVKQFNISSPI